MNICASSLRLKFKRNTYSYRLLYFAVYIFIFTCIFVCLIINSRIAVLYFQGSNTNIFTLNPNVHNYSAHYYQKYLGSITRTVHSRDSKNDSLLINFISISSYLYTDLNKKWLRATGKLQARLVLLLWTFCLV